MNRSLTGMSWLLLALISPVQASALQSLAEIEQTAYLYALNDAQASFNNPQVIVNNMDSRLRLQACNASLQGFANTTPDTLGNRTIGVRCPDASGWTVYVPVKIKVMRPVVVTTKPLAAHVTLTSHDVTIQMRDLGELRQGFVTDQQLVVGQQLKFPLSAGMVVPSRGLKQEKIIRRGEQIMLVAGVGGMQVRMAGTAMDDASLGDRVKVKNLSSERVVEGVVDAPGVVKVTM